MSQSSYRVKKLQDAPEGLKFEGFDCGDKLLNKVARQLTAKEGRNELKAIVLIDTGDNNRYIGYATLQSHHLSKDEFNGSHGQYGNNVAVQLIQYIAVDEKHQKSGFGRLLLQTILKTVLAISELTGVEGVILKSHPRAIDFYLSLGFSPLSIETIPTPEGELDLTLMHMNLAEIRDAL